MEQLLIVENLEKHYQGTGVLGTKKEVRALRGVSFSISAKSSLALVGESGSGKSTLAFCIACLERPTSGRIVLSGKEIAASAESAILCTGDCERAAARARAVQQTGERRQGARPTCAGGHPATKNSPQSRRVQRRAEAKAGDRTGA